jgi:alpha-tubulin suppressor-like RCC1 family protein
MSRGLALAAAALLLPAFASAQNWNDLLRKGVNAAEQELKRQQSQKPAAPAPAPKPGAPQSSEKPPAQAQNNPPAAPQATAAPALGAGELSLPLRRLPLVVGEFGMKLLVETDGTVLSWGTPQGDGSYIGDGTERGREEPAPLEGVRDIVDAAISMRHSVLLRRDGTVLTWGRNDACDLTVKDDRKRLSPFQVAGVRSAVQIAATRLFTAAVLRDGTVMVWGSNEGGLLANGKKERECAYAPVLVEGLSGVKKLVLGHSILVLKEDGTVWGWGANKNGQLCDGTTEPRYRPVQMKNIANAVDIAIDQASSIVLADGTVWRCGLNTYADMAKKPEPDSVKYTTPQQIPGITTAVSVRSDGSTIVRLKDGTLLGWGSGIFGALGNGHIEGDFPRPAPPIGLGPVLDHSYANAWYAIKEDGTMWSWAFYIGDKPGSKKEWQLTPVPWRKVKMPSSM